MQLERSSGSPCRYNRSNGFLPWSYARILMVFHLGFQLVCDHFSHLCESLWHPWSHFSGLQRSYPKELLLVLIPDQRSHFYYTLLVYILWSLGISLWINMAYDCSAIFVRKFLWILDYTWFQVWQWFDSWRLRNGWNSCRIPHDFWHLFGLNFSSKLPLVNYISSIID